MKQYPSFAIVVSFFGLWITTKFSPENQVFIGFSFILTFGILHGANDLLIIKNLLTENKAISFAKLLLSYILIVLLGGFLFFFAPSLILLLFVFISGFHFGEQQLQYLETIENKFATQITQIFYGLLLLFLLFVFHQQEVKNVVTEITKRTLNIQYISYCMYFVTGAFGICFLHLFLNYKKFQKKLLLELFYLIIFSIIFKVASLIWGFAIYFIVWHSIPSIIDQIKFLYGDFSKTNFITYLKSAIIYWIVSLIGLAIFYFGFGNEKLFNTLFFSFLAAITFPHVLVMLTMFGKKDLKV
jgi:beta-carotene 15,15'-dioxygenase